MPRLVADEAPSAFPVMEKLSAKEKGLRTKLHLENGQELTVFNLNKAGQNLLGKVLPEIFEHLGADITNNIKFILC